MPGKVNPTQCEAIVMIAIQVLGDDSAVAFAGSQGNFELNAMRPVIINNFLHSARILADGMEKFRTYSVSGAEPGHRLPERGPHRRVGAGQGPDAQAGRPGQRPRGREDVRLRGQPARHGRARRFRCLTTRVIIERCFRSAAF